MKIDDVMTSPVITIKADAPVQAAAALLASHGFTALPVLDEKDGVLGIVTEADLLRGRVYPEGFPSVTTPATVGGVMTPVPSVMRPEADLADVVSLMIEEGRRSVPIVDGGRLVGIVTRRDVVRVIARGETTSAQVRRRRGR